MKRANSPVREGLPHPSIVDHWPRAVSACLRSMHVECLLLRHLPRDARFAPCAAKRAALARRSRLRRSVRFLSRGRSHRLRKRNGAPGAAPPSRRPSRRLRGLPRKRRVGSSRAVPLGRGRHEIGPARSARKSVASGKHQFDGGSRPRDPCCRAGDCALRRSAARARSSAPPALGLAAR